ncbi:MAG: arsenate reductase [Parvibaculaceae bacterium]
MITVYGLKNCDTCRKALVWLKAEKIAHRFVDFKTDAPDRAEVARFAKAVGWEKLLNKASTTWRSLSDEVKADLNEAMAIALMVEHPALIKRPVFEGGTTILSGFKEPEMKALKAGLK